MVTDFWFTIGGFVLYIACTFIIVSQISNLFWPALISVFIYFVIALSLGPRNFVEITSFLAPVIGTIVGYFISRYQPTKA